MTSSAPDELMLYERAVRGLLAAQVALDAVIALPGSGSVVLLDLNRFGRVNQRFGSLTGDRLLGRVGRSLNRVMHGNGQALAFGGDQFLVVMPDGVMGALPVATLLRAVRRTSVRTRLGRPVRVTASAGIARYPNDGHDVGELLRAAQHNLALATHRSRRGWRSSSTKGMDTGP